MQLPGELAGHVTLIDALPLRTLTFPPLIVTGLGGVSKGGGVT